MGQAAPTAGSASGGRSCGPTGPGPGQARAGHEFEAMIPRAGRWQGPAAVVCGGTATGGGF